VIGMLLEPGPLPQLDISWYPASYDTPDFTDMVNIAMAEADQLAGAMDGLIDPNAIFDEALPDDGMIAQLDALDHANGDNAASINLSGMSVGDGQKADGDAWLTLAVQSIPGEAFTPVPAATQFGTAPAATPTARIAGVTLLDLTTMSGTNFRVGDQYQLQVKMDLNTGQVADYLGVHITAQMILGAVNQPTLEIGVTNSQGLATYLGQWGPGDAGNWIMWVHAAPTTGGDIRSQEYQWSVAAAGQPAHGPTQPAVSVQLQNLTTFDINTNREQDAFGLYVTGPPSSPVYVWATHDGQALPEIQIGTTDANGAFNLNGAWTHGDIGDWVEHYAVGHFVWPSSLTFRVQPLAS
jgi:hypothetical protein